MSETKEELEENIPTQLTNTEIQETSKENKIVKMITITLQIPEYIREGVEYINKLAKLQYIKQH